MIIRKTVSFDSAESIYGRVGFLGIAVPDKYVIKVESARFKLDLSSLTGTGGKNFDDNVLNLFGALGTFSPDSTEPDHPDLLGDAALSLTAQEHSPSVAHASLAHVHTDSEVHLSTSGEFIIEKEYLCGLDVAVGRSGNVALAKGPKVEVLFIVEYDIVKLTSSIMAGMVCSH